MALFQNQATITYGGVTRASNITTGEIVDTVSMEKTALLPTYTPGGVVTYVIGIRNAGENPLTGVTVTDNLGAYGDETAEKADVIPLTYAEGSAKAFAGGVEQTAPTAQVDENGVLTFTGIEVPANGALTLVYQTTANEFAPLGEGAEITNTAAVTGPSIAEEVTAEATVTAETGPDLSITKSVDPAVVTGNTKDTYTFEVQNTGSATEETDAVVIRDTFSPVLTDLVVTLNGETLTENQYSYDGTTGEFATAEGVLAIPGASYAQDPATGAWTVDPGTIVLTVSGVI